MIEFLLVVVLFQLFLLISCFKVYSDKLDNAFLKEKKALKDNAFLTYKSRYLQKTLDCQLEQNQVLSQINEAHDNDERLLKKNLYELIEPVLGTEDN